MTHPTLSILVISRTSKNVSRLLNAINTNRIGFSYEVLCSWNGSEEGPNDIEVPENIDFKLIEQRPYNFAQNNNGLAESAKGEYLLFINDDVIPDKGAIAKAYKAILNPGVGMVGINLRYKDNRLQHAGIFFREDGTPFHRYKHEVKWNDPRISADMFVPCVTGAFILIRKKEFDQIQFDEEFGVCGEDIALNLSYREKFDREILYVANASAVHIENETRKETGERLTPQEDMDRIHTYSRRVHDDIPITKPVRPKIRIVTEKPGWIMHRMAEEIQKHMGEDNVRINDQWQQADINYYINYGYFNKKPQSGLTIANFTHFDPDHLADKFLSVAKEVDHCIAISEATADVLRESGIPEEKISVIVVGADMRFKPKLNLGIVGRVYSGGRKGEDIVQELVNDEELMEKVNIVSTSEGWNVPVWNFDDIIDFYRAIDYLLVPSRLEGGPVPFMEALACGTMSIAPEIGVIPQFPHISYPVGNVESLKYIISDLADQHLLQREFLVSTMKGINWAGWAVEHEKVFRSVLHQQTK